VPNLHSFIEWDGVFQDKCFRIHYFMSNNFQVRKQTRVEITLVRVEITLVRVEITLVRMF
jgi:hypothetical protein